MTTTLGSPGYCNHYMLTRSKEYFAGYDAHVCQLLPGHNGKHVAGDVEWTDGEAAEGNQRYWDITQAMAREEDDDE